MRRARPLKLARVCCLEAPGEAEGREAAELGEGGRERGVCDAGAVAQIK